MNVINLSEFKKLFIDTANEYINTTRSTIQQNTVDQNGSEQLHIAFHSLKSQSNTMGYLQTANYCHNLEKFMKEVIAQKRQITEQEKQLLAECVEVIAKSIMSVDTNDTESITEQEVQEIAHQFGQL